MTLPPIQTKMNEDAIRAAVRDAIERQLGRPSPAGAAGAPPDFRLHPSHVRLHVASGSAGDGPCLVEPAVQCVHCGYCQSFGH